MNKIVEINNTDVEERLVLPDYLFYRTTALKANKLIVVTTLTGTMPRASGDNCIGIWTTSDQTCDYIKKAVNLRNELIWSLW